MSAHLAFDAKFRALLADSCQWAIGKGIPPSPNPHCGCPEGCLPDLPVFGARRGYHNPQPFLVQEKYGFTTEQHGAFQRAFDFGQDNGTPEAALGLLYRERFSK